MNNFAIITDSTCDLPKSFIEKEDIVVINLLYTIDSKTYDGSENNNLSPEQFYKKMRAGNMATTALINPLMAKEAIEKQFKLGKDVLYISFSSALSGSYQSAVIAMEELKEQYDNKITVIDSKCASLGEGLLIYYANEYRKKDKSYEDTVEYIKDLRHHICHYFTVNDLFHLYRGGRVTKSKAVVGSLLKIKPILYVNEEGKLIPLKNSIGRKKSLMGLVSCMENKIENENQTVFISHGDCIEDADFLAKKVEEKFGIKDFLISTIGPVIGSHSGPDTVALFFVGKDKIENKNTNNN